MSRGRLASGKSLRVCGRGWFWGALRQGGFGRVFKNLDRRGWIWHKEFNSRSALGSPCRKTLTIMKKLIAKILLNTLLLLAAGSAGAQVLTPAALKSALSSATQASIISLSGVNVLNCPEVSRSQTWDG